MSKEIKAFFDTGYDLYYHIYKDADLYGYDIATETASDNVAWASLCVDMFEMPNLPRVYYGDLPAWLPAGTYWVPIYCKAGVNYLSTDEQVGGCLVYWTGSVVKQVALENTLSQGVTDIRGDLSTLADRLTAARAEYLDKLNVAGTLANTDNADSFKANVAALALEASVQALALVATEARLSKLDATISSRATPADCIDDEGIRTALGMAAADLDTQLDAINTNTDTEAAAIIQAITDLLTPVTSLPLPSISIDTIKTLLQLHDDTYDDLLTLLIPVIEDIVAKYCGVSSVSTLTVGSIFPIAGLVRYAMENPIGAKSQTIGSDRTEYGEFPNALLKLLDNFKPDSTGGSDHAAVINLRDINNSLGK